MLPATLSRAIAFSIGCMAVPLAVAACATPAAQAPSEAPPPTAALLHCQGRPILVTSGYSNAAARSAAALCSIRVRTGEARYVLFSDRLAVQCDPLSGEDLGDACLFRRPITGKATYDAIKRREADGEG